MGLPAGWVGDVPSAQLNLFDFADPDLSRREQLSMLGNGVVPTQAAAALRVLGVEP